MLILDTNVLAEPMKRDPSPEVLRWMAAQHRTSIYVTAISQAEVLYGLAILPHGKRRARFAAEVDLMFENDFAGRILPFDSAAAGVYAEIFSSRRLAGRPMSQPDAMIAAIARLHGATLVTRDTKGFSNCGIGVVNPWTAEIV